jgi:hypothetical protein
MIKSLQLALRNDSGLTQHAEELKTFMSIHNIDCHINLKAETTTNHRHQNVLVTQRQAKTLHKQQRTILKSIWTLEYNSGEWLRLPT